MNINQINSLVLAYLGDAIYEIYIREYLIKMNLNKVKDLQKSSVEYVSARAQAVFLNNLINDNFFSDDEIDIIKRARNAKCLSHPKSVDILTYKHATALEAVIGYLHILNKDDRIKLIMEYITKGE
jgi:ribonuclease-3 family protein